MTLDEALALERNRNEEETYEYLIGTIDSADEDCVLKTQAWLLDEPVVEEVENAPDEASVASTFVRTENDPKVG